jgi:hypothetical protein
MLLTGKNIGAKMEIVHLRTVFVAVPLQVEKANHVLRKHGPK